MEVNMKKITWKPIVLCMALWFVAAGVTFCAEKDYKLLCKETFLDMESVSSARISPDGTQILFARSWMDKMEDRGRSNIWIVDIDGTRVIE